MIVLPLRAGQEFSFDQPMRAYSYQTAYPNSIYQGGLYPHEEELNPSWPGDFVRVVQPEERLIADDLMAMDVLGHWSLTAGVTGIGSLVFSQRLHGEHTRHIHNDALKRFKQRDAVDVKDIRWPEPTPESLMVQVRVLSRYGADGSIENRRSFSPIQWRKCEELERLPLDQGLQKAIEMLSSHRFVPDPAASLRERGFVI